MNPRTTCFAACCAAFACLAPPAGQASPAIANGSFENQLDDWTIEGNVTVQSALPYRPTDGTSLAAFNAMNTTGTARIYQYLATTEGRAYRLRFDAGNLGYHNKTQTLRVQVGGYIGTDWHQLNFGEVEVDIPGTTGGNTRWITRSIDFTPLPGQAVLVEFADVSQYSNAVDLVLDNVTIEEITPTVDFTNGGFESGLEGWDSGGNVAVRDTAPYLASEGRRLAVFNSANTQNNGYLARQISLTPGQPYLLSFDVGNLSFNRLPQHLTLWVLWGYKGSLVMDTIEIPGGIGGSTTWVSKSYPFTSPASIIRIWFADASTATTATDLVLDNIRITPVRSATTGFFNGSFEDGFAGWDVNTAAGGVTVQSTAPYAPTDGASLAAFSNGNSGNYASLSQTIDTVPGQSYDLVLDVGNLSYAARPQCLRTLIDDGNYRLLNSAIWISSTSVSGGTHWLRDQTYRFTARGASTTFTFLDASTTTAGVDLVLDHIRLLPR